MTRYAVRHHDGKWLAKAHLDGRIVVVWTADLSLRWTWGSMTGATMAGFEADDFKDLDWTVEPVTKEHPRDHV